VNHQSEGAIIPSTTQQTKQTISSQAARYSEARNNSDNITTASLPGNVAQQQLFSAEADTRGPGNNMGYTSAAHLHHHYHHYNQHQQQQAWNKSTDSNGRAQHPADFSPPSPAVARVEKDYVMEEGSTTTALTHATGHTSHHADDDDTTTIRSFDGLLSLTEDDEAGGNVEAPSARHVEGASTCSVSTVATDEASSLGDWASYDTTTRMKQQQQHFPLAPQQQQHHRRVPSWEVSPHSQFSLAGRGSPAAVHLPPALSPQGWSAQQQHVASFRGEHPQYPPRNSSGWNQQTPPRYAVDQSLPFLPGTNGRGSVGDRNGRQSNTYAYHAQQQQRKPYSQPLLPPSNNVTPPRVGSERAGRGHQRVPSGSSPHRLQPSPQGGSGGNSRSSSEVLKTLLRKKACLYEPDTSRAVALVTWLVGRELALQYGFFSRQQLQAGVHACVLDKIDSGAITRTKVNRCMQIILNSCFHYIIPRPDGTEESGDVFRAVFQHEMKDDRFLLSVLPVPWNDISVDLDSILNASLDEVDSRNPRKSPFQTPVSSPRLGPLSDKGSPGRESVDGDSSDAKRAVLLCFNENVRSAEDVFRCHNEFIRDTAHASHLQLSSNEWRIFFGKEAANAPHLWGNVGIPVPYLEGQGPSQTDALGMFTVDEVGCLRTSWCCKRYEHDHELCGFAHTEINGGWLRRSPNIQYYKDEICPFVSALAVDFRDGVKQQLSINECPHGIKCEFAHSVEESMYHPRRYKHQVCPSVGRSGGCSLVDICPKFHPADSYRFSKKSDARSPRHPRQPSQQVFSGGKGSTQMHTAVPSGSPILYASPAPLSSYEEHLMMPGLQNLFRRNCTIFRATQRSGNNSVSQYSLFGDDTGVYRTGDGNPTDSQAVRPPQHLRR
jgi:hypothetical protein